MRRLVVVALVLAGLGASARAGYSELDALLDQAGREKAALRYQDGLATLDKARRLGRATPEQLRGIYRSAGELAAGLGDDATATDQFERWLVLEPGAALPDGTSPKLVRPFEAARAWLGAHQPLRVRFDAHAGRAPTLTMIVYSDPLAMVAGARAHVRADGGAEVLVEARGQGRVELALPPGRRLLVVAAAIDEYGNELTEHGSWEVPIVIGDGPAARPGGGGAPARVHPIYARWWVWGAAGVAIGGAGLLFGDRMNAAQDEFDALKADSAQHGFDEVDAVAARGRRWAFAADASFVAAGACGVAAVVFLVRDGYEREDTGVTVAPSASSGSLGMMVSGTF